MHPDACRLVALTLGLVVVLAAPCHGQASEETIDPALEHVLRALEPGWYARLDTGKGVILARLLPEQAPQSVAHFAGLARGTLEWADPVSGKTPTAPYYDGGRVDRALAGRLFAVGQRSADGVFGPALWVPEDEGTGPIHFGNAPSALGLVSASFGRTSAVQFFVTAAVQRGLSPRHPCFGVVVHGQDVAFNISQVKTDPGGKPIEPVMIERVRVFAVGDPPPLPEPERHQPTLRNIDFVGTREQP